MIPALIAALPALIGVAEKLINKPKAGPEKKSAVIAMARVVAEKMQANRILELQPTDEEIGEEIERQIPAWKAGQSIAAPVQIVINVGR